MRYELYGVFTNAGDNDKLGVYQSMKLATDAMKLMDSSVYQNFLILTKARKDAAPIECISGIIKEGIANRVKSFLTGENPTREKDRKRYWSESDDGEIINLFGYQMTKRQERELKRILELDILTRYNEPEYWDPDLVECFVCHNKLQSTKQ